MKKLDKQLVGELIRVMKKYWRTGDTDLLAKKREVMETLEKSLGEEKNPECIVDLIDHITRIMHFKSVTYATVYKIINLLGYELEEDKVECALCHELNNHNDLVKARYDDVRICEDCKRDGN